MSRHVMSNAMHVTQYYVRDRHSYHVQRPFDLYHLSTPRSKDESTVSEFLMEEVTVTTTATSNLLTKPRE
jgi:hypothetical protein